MWALLRHCHNIVGFSWRLSWFWCQSISGKEQIWFYFDAEVFLAKDKYEFVDAIDTGQTFYIVRHSLPITLVGITGQKKLPWCIVVKIPHQWVGHLCERGHTWRGFFWLRFVCPLAGLLFAGWLCNQDQHQVVNFLPFSSQLSTWKIIQNLQPFTIMIFGIAKDFLHLK